MARMEPGRLPKYLLFRELSTDEGTPKGCWKRWVRCLGKHMGGFSIPHEGWVTAAHKSGEWQASVETGLETSIWEWRFTEAAETTICPASVAAKGNSTPSADTGTGIASSR